MNLQTKSKSVSRTTYAKAIGLSLFLLSALVTCPPVQADDTTAQLRASVARMNDWLGFGSNARVWRKYLNLNLLDSLSARGEQADPAKLHGILNRFEGGPSSLKHEIFKSVKDSIGAQIDQLERSHVYSTSDLQFAVTEAMANFHKPEKSELESQRGNALKQLRNLKAFYRRDYDSRTRAIVFYELQLSEVNEFLSDIEIEMPPEVSVGKMSAMIEDEASRLEDITDKIDARPLTTPTEDSDEDDLDVDIVLTLPGPDADEEDDLDTLESKKEAIEERIKQLKKRRSEVFKLDKPRQLRRRDIGRELRRIQGRFQELAKKQTNNAFTAATRAISQFTDDYIFATEDNIQQEFLEQVNLLAELLPQLEDPQARSAHANVGSILSWLESRQQLNDLCVAIRRRYSNPNAYVAASSRLIQGLTTRTTSDCEKVAEDFLGRFARGLSRSDATLNVVPVDNPDQVQIRLLLNGTVATSTYIRERKFRINSTAAGNFSASRDLYASLNGLFATEPSSCANVKASYGGISTSFGLIQRIAEKSFQEEESKTNAESSRRVNERLAEQFESETTTAIDGAVEQLEDITAKVRRYAAFLPQIYFRSFSGHVEAVVKKDERFALGATVAPSFRSAGSDVQVKLHESMLSNYLDPIFAGRTFTQDDFAAELESYGIDLETLAEPVEAEAEEIEEIEDFKITFSKVRPVQLMFDNNVLEVLITGTRFEQGDNLIRARVTIQVRLNVVRRNGKLFLEAAGAPEIALAEDQEPDAESIAFAKILEERLVESFEAAEKKGVELPAELIPDLGKPNEAEPLRSMQLGLLELKDGWLYLGWNWQGGIVSTPAIVNEVLIEEYAPVYQLDAVPQIEVSEPQSILLDGLGSE